MHSTCPFSEAFISEWKPHASWADTAARASSSAGRQQPSAQSQPSLSTHERKTPRRVEDQSIRRLIRKDHL
jgi:hypothetical protein